jgi:hypothetical protein
LGNVTSFVTAASFHSQIRGVPALAPAFNPSFWNTRSEMMSPLKSNRFASLGLTLAVVVGWRLPCPARHPQA